MTENYYTEIKEILINNEINKKVKDYSKNKVELESYYNVGKLLYDVGKHYGEGIIKNYSIKLMRELGKKYTYTVLSRMRQFYIKFQNVATMWQLSWSHYRILLPIKDVDKTNYYLNITIRENLSVRELERRIKSKEYERLSNETKIKLIENKESNIKDLIKDPIIINNKTNYEIINEKVLQRAILEDIPSFLKELGNGFTFIDNEYKIKIGGSYNYIDFLLYNYIYKAFIVVELKVTPLKKEHIGQIQIYMNYIDKNLKGMDDHKSIGIIICKKNNRYIMEYCSDKRILSREYEIMV